MAAAAAGAVELEVGELLGAVADDLVLELPQGAEAGAAVGGGEAGDEVGGAAGGGGRGGGGHCRRRRDVMRPRGGGREGFAGNVPR